MTDPTKLTPIYDSRHNSNLSDADLSLNQSDTTITPQASMSSMGSITSALRSPRVATPRRAITPRQAIDTLELGVTQANDLQHLFEKYRTQIDEKAINVRLNIEQQFEDITAQLIKRKDILHQQVEAWKTEKLRKVNKDIDDAADYEQTLLKAKKACNDIVNDDKLDQKLKKKEIKQIKNGIFQGSDENFKKYKTSKGMTQYINDVTNLIDIEWQTKISPHDLSKYGKMTSIPNNAFLSVPVLNLLEPIKGKESRSGYKLKLKWNTSQPLIADNFIIRCLTLDRMSDKNKNKNNNDNDDEKKQQKQQHHHHHNEWKSLIFQIKRTNEENTNFEAQDIETVFLFDKLYKFRIEYHITDPVNLLIGSNEQQLMIENLPPQSNKADLIDLEYYASKGNSYEGHPNNLLTENEGKVYRSSHNNDFDYGENDWIIFKLKHSGFARQYLPKAIIIKNSEGTQAVKEMIISIGAKGDGKEWNDYSLIELERNGDEYQQASLQGVDWRIIKYMKQQYIKLKLMKNYGEARGSQCRFKWKEFRLYGLEFN